MNTDQESVAAWYERQDRATQAIHRAWVLTQCHEAMLRQILEEVRAAGDRPPHPATEPERGRLVPFPARRSLA